jgi:hypothetical protein
MTRANARMILTGGLACWLPLVVLLALYLWGN